LKQFEACQVALEEELGVGPAGETIALYEKIQSGELKVPPAGPPRAIPSGTVTFLFTDMVSSTTLWEVFPRDMPEALARHDALLEQAAVSHHGYVFKRVGDGLCIAFQSAADALLAAVEGQRALLAEAWGEIGPLRVRMAIHSGVVDEREEDYFGMAVNQVARLTAVAGGGQILLSQAALALVGDQKPAGVKWLDLGHRSFTGLSQPVHIHQVVAPGLPARFVSSTPSESLSGNLPKRATAFVGRQRELARIDRLLATGRLVNLSGPGGIGKTRLALAAAEGQLDHYRDGVYFVPLLSLDSVSAVVPAIANALGLVFREGSSPRGQLLDYLHSRQMLLVLDNMEHLLARNQTHPDIGGILGLVEEMLEVAPGLKILATSREVLNLSSEQIFLVEGLPVGNSGSKKTDAGEALDGESAAELFSRRARRVRPGFGQAIGEDLDLIRQLCRLVEGMPLAIELAAAQLRLLSLAEITAEIKENLGVLDTSLRGSSDRHSSIRLVFEASWRSLDEQQQRIFAKLSVFRGGFTRQAALEVAGATLPDLAVLLDKSLIRREASGRFVRHALVRVYSAEKLAEDPADLAQTQARHFAYYARILHGVVTQWQITNEAASISALEPEADNLLAAWRWELDQSDWDEAATYLDGLWRFLKLQRRLPEAIELLEEALQIGKASEPRAERHYQAHWERLLGEAYLSLSQFEEGNAHFKQVVSLLGWPLPGSRAGLLLGFLKQLSIQGLHRLAPGAFIGRLEHKREIIREAFTAYERLGFRAAVENESLLAVFCFFQALNLAEVVGLPRLMARAYVLTGFSFGLIPLRRVAEAYLTWAQTLAREEASLGLQERVFGMTGIYLASIGRWDEAVENCRQAVAVARELGQHWDEVTYLVVLSFVAHLRGNYDLALDYARQVSDTANRSGDVGSEVAALYWEAVFKLRQDDVDQVIQLLKESAAAPAEVMNSFDWIILRGTLAQAYLRQGREEFAVHEADKAAVLIAKVSRPSNFVSFYGYAGVAAVYLTLWERKKGEEKERVFQSSARQAVRDLRAFARVFPVARPRAWLQQGLYDWLDGKERKAYRAWRKSLACAEELDMPFEQGLAHYEIGRHLSAGEKTKEGWGARDHLQQACEIFAGLGTTYDLGQAQAKLATRTGPVSL
ncbi:MAG: adenylate/guanylate cyclase domain-containing protein, partial [Chloroflexota bacterium]|jgi:predicted ATPase/class 3 adenylate cyclase